MRHALKSSFLTAGFLLGSVPFSYSQANREDIWTAVVDRQLDKYSASLRNVGYTKSTTTFADSVSQGNQQYIEVTLNAHTSYSFLGVCDQDCRDIDLFLRDSNGYLVDSDTARDDTPAVTVVPRYTGVFRLYIKMVSCSNNPCRWGIGIYLRG
jgi:hypothetical protein